MSYVIVHIAGWQDFETGKRHEEVDYFKSYVANTAIFTKDVNSAAVINDAGAEVALAQLRVKLPEHDLALIVVDLPVNWTQHRLRDSKPHEPPTVQAMAKKHKQQQETAAKHAVARKMAKYLKKKTADKPAENHTAGPDLKKFLEE
jgi:hypothetical protein